MSQAATQFFAEEKISVLSRGAEEYDVRVEYKKPDYYALPDGRYWDVANGKWVSKEMAETAQDANIVTLGHIQSEEDFVESVLKFYGYPLGVLASNEDKLAAIREQRKVLLEKYDAAVAQLNRQMRMTSDTKEQETIQAKIAEWDVYAQALCDLPAQSTEYAIDEIPWPKQPA